MTFPDPSASVDLQDERVLNAALREAVDFVQAEGWDQPATLFALVPAALVADAAPQAFDDDASANPLALVVQEGIPEDIRPGSEELGQFLATIRWPAPVVGAILAQEITSPTPPPVRTLPRARLACLADFFVTPTSPAPNAPLSSYAPARRSLQKILSARTRFNCWAGTISPPA